MKLLTSPQKKISNRHMSVAAESIVAAQFALCGFDVMEQATRARFDLGVKKSGDTMKVIVHGSLDGFWDLVDLYPDKERTAATKDDYHRAIDRWLAKQSAQACCLVQFESTDLNGMPRIYLATAAEIAERLHATAEHLGDPALYEQYEITVEDGSHLVESLPSQWRFSQARIAEVMAQQAPLQYRFSSAPRCKACATAHPAACLDCLPMMN